MPARPPAGRRPDRASGAAHLHQFFGSTAADAKSTVRELETAPTTCDQRRDTAAYWMPTVYRQSKAVTDLALAFPHVMVMISWPITTS